MPNWATTYYAIEGNAEDLHRINVIARAFIEKRRRPSLDDPQNDWGGNILMALGATEEETEKMRISCFMEKSEIDSNGTLRMQGYSAWRRDDFHLLLSKLYPGLTIYFYTKEPLMQIFQSNDVKCKYFPRYMVYAEINDEIKNKEFRTRKEKNKYIADFIGHGKNTYNKQELKEWNEKHINDFSEEKTDLWSEITPYKVRNIK